MTLNAISTVLPTLHPAVVHLPIALLLTALVFDVGCLVIRRLIWLDRASAALTVLGTAGLLAAVVTGDHAAEAAASVTGPAAGLLTDHADLGAWFVAMLLRVYVWWLGCDDRRVHIGIYRLASLTVSLVAAWMLVVTATSGHALVFHHGVGVLLN